MCGKTANYKTFSWWLNHFFFAFCYLLPNKTVSNSAFSKTQPNKNNEWCVECRRFRLFWDFNICSHQSNFKLQFFFNDSVMLFKISNNYKVAVVWRLLTILEIISHLICLWHREYYDIRAKSAVFRILNKTNEICNHP